MRLLNKSL